MKKRGSSKKGSSQFVDVPSRTTTVRNPDVSNFLKIPSKTTFYNVQPRNSFLKIPYLLIVSFEREYKLQEAMENFVFPDEIKTKLMKMSKLRNIFYVP